MFGFLSVYSPGIILPCDLHGSMQLLHITFQHLHTTSLPPFSPFQESNKKKAEMKFGVLVSFSDHSSREAQCLEDKKRGENGLITAVTFHLQPRRLAVGLKDSPSLPLLLPSAMSHLRFTASALQLLQPTGHRGKLDIPGLSQDAWKLWENNKGEG